MSLLNENITEDIQKQIYNITAKLGAAPSNIRSYGGELVQVNWIANGKSYMWRSEDYGVEMTWLEIYSGPADISSISISDL